MEGNIYLQRTWEHGEKDKVGLPQYLQ